MAGGTIEVFERRDFKFATLAFVVFSDLQMAHFI